MDYILWEKWKEIPDIMDLTFIQYNILRFLRNALNQECGIENMYYFHQLTEQVTSKEQLQKKVVLF